jgi:hypothetical protein
MPEAFGCISPLHPGEISELSLLLTDEKIRERDLAKIPSSFNFILTNVNKKPR